MQATVREFEPGSGSGSVFLDDGTVCPFGPEAFAASGLRRCAAGSGSSSGAGRPGRSPPWRWPRCRCLRSSRA